MGNVRIVFKTILNLHRPIIKNTVFFQSFYGQYNDSPKYISEELHRRNPSIQIVWTIRDGKREDFPPYVKLVELNSDEYVKYISRAEVVVDNYTGCRTFLLQSNNIVRRIMYRMASKKRKGQLNVSTWHGTPLKHVSLDEPQYVKAKFKKIYSSSNVIVSDSDLTTKAFETAFEWNGKPLLKTGLPRNDLLFKERESGLREKLGFPKDKKVVLFAPTFRDSVENSGLKQLKELDINLLLKTLSDKFGGEWCFAFRCHGNVMSKVLADDCLKNDFIINANEYPDMAEYLSVVDVLLTDYSSCMFDYVFSKKPCFLYTPDLQNYKNSERGFYFDVSETPFNICEDEERLISAIISFDMESYQEKCKAFFNKIGKYEDGNASKNIVDLIMKKMEGR